MDRKDQELNYFIFLLVYWEPTAPQTLNWDTNRTDIFGFHQRTQEHLLSVKSYFTQFQNSVYDILIILETIFASRIRKFRYDKAKIIVLWKKYTILKRLTLHSSRICCLLVKAFIYRHSKVSLHSNSVQHIPKSSITGNLKTTDFSLSITLRKE